jgi:hypothetical protein
MIGGAPIFMPPSPAYTPYSYAPTSYAPAAPARAAVPAPVYRGVMGKEKEPARQAVPRCRKPFTIPTPEELGVVPTATAALPCWKPFTIPTPEELGVAGKR